jgi:hypothetical protein
MSESGTTLTVDGNLTATKVYNAVYNDIADYFEMDYEIEIEYGKVYIYDNGVRQSREYCEMGILGIATDTYGFGVGNKENTPQIPISVAGYVLAYVDGEYLSGTPLTCTSDGMITKMKREDVIKYPERIVGTYIKKEYYLQWNDIVVNGRHWIKIK